MKLNESLISISYLEENTADIIDDINKNQSTFIITQNGESRVVIQDFGAYTRMRETMVMLKLLALTEEKSESATGIESTFATLRNDLSSLL